MSKILGYVDYAGKHWFKESHYDKKQIDNITDPEGGKVEYFPVSIPSPFARIELAKTAFEKINQTSELKHETKGNKVIASIFDEKIVSQIFDILQLLFYYDNYKDNIRIFSWNIKEGISKLKNNPNHKRLAECMESHLEQDKNAYHFDKLLTFFVIQYDYQIIGANSPVTLFFPTGEDISFNFKLSDKHEFFKTPLPLYERDKSFQLFIYAWINALKNATNHLTHIREYLEKNLRILSNKNKELFNEIQSLIQNDINEDYLEQNYIKLELENISNINIVQGLPIYKIKPTHSYLNIQKSDFVIYSEKFKGDNKPLVLPTKEFNEPLTYIHNPWNPSIRVPFYDDKPLEERILPDTQIKYPYLTLADFLEPNLIQLVYPLNDEDFFDGNFEKNQETEGYLLPLKKTFFEYFDVQDLFENNNPLKPSIKLQKKMNSIVVTLKIPIQKEKKFITYEKQYDQVISYHSDEVFNERGAIIQKKIGLTIFPTLQSSNIKEYVVHYINRKSNESEPNIQFFNSHTQNIDFEKQTVNKSTEYQSIVYTCKGVFDFIQIELEGIKGILIPKWENTQERHETFEFAIDFGTSNFHVEYKKDTSAPMPLEIKFQDRQIATLFKPNIDIGEFLYKENDYAIRDAINEEFLPLVIKKGETFELPSTTALAHIKQIKLDKKRFIPLYDTNISFIYGKQGFVSNNPIKLNLKWESLTDNQKYIHSFLSEIAAIIRNKVLMEGGSFDKIKIKWLYPISMKHKRVSKLQELWEDINKHYFEGKANVTNLPESFAPYYAFKEQGVIKGGKSSTVLSVDVGGGTIDVVAIKEKPIKATSFKFGANVIFGDGYAQHGANKNGFIIKYFDAMMNILEKNQPNHNELSSLSDSIKKIKDENKNSMNIFNLFFSLEKVLNRKGIDFITEHLKKDETFKIIFLYYYTAIIYYLGKWMKHYGMEFPKEILFSGTGSKVLLIISSDMNTLSNYSSRVLKKIFEIEEAPKLSIHIEKDYPKEITCKGALLIGSDDKPDTDIVAQWKGEEMPENLTYKQLKNQIANHIIEQIKKFNQFFIDTLHDFKAYDYFDLDKKVIPIFREYMNEHLEDFLMEGIEQNMKIDDINEEDELEETPFFYPLIGTIYHTASELANQTSNN